MLIGAFFKPGLLWGGIILVIISPEKPEEFVACANSLKNIKGI
jgi:hypothetical protein